MREHPSSTPFIDSGSKDKYGKKPLQSPININTKNTKGIIEFIPSASWL